MGFQSLGLDTPELRYLVASCIDEKYQPLSTPLWLSCSPTGCARTVIGSIINEFGVVIGCNDDVYRLNTEKSVGRCGRARVVLQSKIKATHVVDANHSAVYMRAAGWSYPGDVARCCAAQALEG